MVCLSSILSVADFLKVFSFPFFFYCFLPLSDGERGFILSPVSARALAFSHPSAEVALRWLIDG